MFDLFKKKKEVEGIGIRILPEDDPRRFHPVISETGKDRVLDTYSKRYDKYNREIYNSYSPKAFDMVEGRYVNYLRRKKEVR